MTFQFNPWIHLIRAVVLFSAGYLEDIALTEEEFQREQLLFEDLRTLTASSGIIAIQEDREHDDIDDLHLNIDLSSEIEAPTNNGSSKPIPKQSKVRKQDRAATKRHRHGGDDRDKDLEHVTSREQKRLWREERRRQRQKERQLKRLQREERRKLNNSKKDNNRKQRKQQQHQGTVIKDGIVYDDIIMPDIASRKRRETDVTDNRNEIRLDYGDPGTSARSRSRRAATARRDRLWDDAVIPYEIDSNFSGMYHAYLSEEKCFHNKLLVPVNDEIYFCMIF